MTALGEKEYAAPILPGLRAKGDVIAGRYRVEKLLGAGSSGFVVAARHVYLRRSVTLKILVSSGCAHPGAQRRHLDAAHTAAGLRGEHVARIVDTGFTEDGLAFLATEGLDGRTLAEELAARTLLPVEEAVRWILEACEGLAEAHAAGIVHADLKPQNLFLATAGARGARGAEGAERRVLKILDFGTPMPLAEDAEGSSAWFASPAYRAPEQLRDPDGADARADIWALGVILHQLVAGTLPFSADTVSGMFVAVAYDEPALLATPDVPFELARLVKACLAKDPAARPRDVSALARALAPFAGEGGETLASRVEAALSLPPPSAMTVDAEPAALAAGSVEGPRSRDARRRPARRERRRRSAIAAALVIGSLAGIGVVVSPSSAPSRSTAEGPPAEATSTAALVPLPFAPVPLEVASSAGGGAPGAPDEATPLAGGGMADEATPVRQLPAADGIAARPAAPPRHEPGVAAALLPLERRPTKEPSPAKAASRAKASLSVREDPYPRGFTHPTRLSEHRRPK